MFQSTVRFVCLCVVFLLAASSGGCGKNFGEPEASGPEDPRGITADRPSGVSEALGQGEGLSQLTIQKSIQRVPSQTSTGQELSEQVREVLAKLVQAYRAANTYQDQAEMRTVAQLREGARQEQSFPMSLTFVRPNKIAFRSPYMEVFCEGQQRTVHIPFLNQYVMEAAPETITSENFAGDSLPEELGSMGGLQIPLRLVLLCGGNPWSRILEGVNQVKLAQGTSEIDGHACHVLEFDRDEMDSMMYIDTETYLVRQVVYDATALIENDPHLSELIDSMEYVLELSGAVANAAVNQMALMVSLPEGARKVDGFELDEAESSPPSPLLGQSAPDFTVTALNGDEIQLKNLLGQVVVIDFWATWCTSCMAKLPMVEAVWKQYKDRAVRFLAVSVDNPQTTEQEEIEKMLVKLGITFTPIHDKEGSLIDAFGVESIPLLVLVDKQGTVQAVHSGTRESLGDELSKQINALLDGRSILQEPIEAAQTKSKTIQ